MMPQPTFRFADSQSWQLLLLVTAAWLCGAHSSEAQSTRSPHAVVERGIQAMGGPSAIRRLQTPMMWMERGTLHESGKPLEFIAQYAARWPDWNREEIENASVITRRAEEVWVHRAGGKAARLPEAARAERLGQMHQAWAMRLFPLLKAPYELTSISDERVGDQVMYGVLAKHPEHRDMRFYFEAESGLPVKVVTQVVSPQTGPQPVRSEAHLSNHRNLGGVTLPGRVQWFRDGKLHRDARLVDYKFAATLDPAQFAPPPTFAKSNENTGPGN